MRPRLHAPHLRFGPAARAAVLVASAAMLFLLAVGSASAASGGIRMTESNERYAFTPANVFVKVGSSLTWTNTTDVAHTVTADSGTSLASDQIGDGKTFSATFDTVGTIAYHCEIHPYMKGRIVVVAADATLPPTDAAPATATQSPTGFSTVWLMLVAVGCGAAALLLRARRLLGR